MRTRTPPKLLALAALIVSFPCWAADPPGEWEPGEKKQGPGYAYQIFSIQKEGEQFLRFQVRGTIDAPAEHIQRTASRLSTDPARAPEGQKRTVLYKDDDETVMLTEIDMPSPFTDRDTVTRGKLTVDSATGTRRIDFKTAEHASAPAPKPGVIRLLNTGGYWEFVPDGADRTKVTSETYVDLGGSLPLWLISGMMGDNAASNFEEVAKESLRK